TLYKPITYVSKSAENVFGAASRFALLGRAHLETVPNADLVSRASGLKVNDLDRCLRDQGETDCRNGNARSHLMIKLASYATFLRPAAANAITARSRSRRLMRA